MNKKLLLLLFSIVIFFSGSCVFAFGPSSSELHNGIDVSEWQGDINFSEVKQSGIDVVYIKSSQGSNYVDPYFKTHYENAKANGLNIGFYHFLTAYTEEEAIEEARFFVSVINNYASDCRLAMDFEQFGDLSVSEINEISTAFLDTVTSLTNKEVVIYSDASNARNVFGPELASKYPIWVADYYVSEPANGNWSSWIGFQYTNKGEISGIDGYVDRDYFTNEIFLSDSSSINVDNLPNPSTNENCIIVQRGDTLSAIAEKYNTSYLYLAKVNNIPNPNLIYTCQKICVPNLDDSGLNDTSHMLYVIKWGNTLNMISKLFDVPVQDIVDLNDIPNPNLIYAGQILRIPVINKH